MKKRVVIPIAVAIVVGGTVAAKKLLTKSKNQDGVPATPPSGEDVQLTETQKVLRDRETWKV